MFLENTVNLNGEFGWIEVICGSMFSGKTEELIRRLRRAVIAKQNVQVFKPIIDNRYQAAKVSSHNGDAFEAQPIEKAADLRDQLKDLEKEAKV